MENCRWREADDGGSKSKREKESKTGYRPADHVIAWRNSFLELSVPGRQNPYESHAF